MHSLFRTLVPLFLLITWATNARSEADAVVVNVEAMIGEATFVQESGDGKKETLVVPTGKTTQSDPETGKVSLAPATATNKVNEVVHAIAASQPDAGNRVSTDKGCSKGQYPQRPVPRPTYDKARATAIEESLGALSSGELMLVMAVLINNASHLCIDAAAVANTVAMITTVRPEEARNVVFVASLLDPDNSDRYTDAALQAAPGQTKNIEQAREEAEGLGTEFGTPTPTGSTNPAPAATKPSIEPERDIPPGGAIGAPPSPE